MRRKVLQLNPELLEVRQCFNSRGVCDVEPLPIPAIALAAIASQAQMSARDAIGLRWKRQCISQEFQRLATIPRVEKTIALIQSDRQQFSLNKIN